MITPAGARAQGRAAGSALPALSPAERTRVTRLMRSSLLEVLNRDYVRTAQAKGLAGRAVIYKHALSNALLPVITDSPPAR